MTYNTEYSVSTEDLVIENGVKSIYGKLFKPQTNGKHPVIIMSHGYNGCHANYQAEGSFFASKGYLCFAFDFCGGSAWSKSSGKTTEMTVFTEKQDLLDVFERISKLDIADSEEIYLMGESMGGLVTTLAAEELSDRVKGLVLYYPAMIVPDDWRKKYPAVEEIPELTDFWGITLGRDFFLSIHDFYPFEAIKNFRNKVLIVQGDSDGIVPLTCAEKTAELYEKSRLEVLEGEGHGFSAEKSKIAMEIALEFLRN